VDRQQVLRALADRIGTSGRVGNADELYRKLWEREELGSTGVGSGIAIPHCKLNGLRQGVVAVGLAPGGVDFGAADGAPVRVFFLVVSPSTAAAEHLQVLAAISRWIKADRHVERLLELREPEAIAQLLREAAPRV
jgi:mannitol/fructose-specific phosphotransferase system IIA component (Ntr-type)